MKTSINLFSFSNLSIKQRLPLLIFILLFSIIVTFSWISYLGVKNASLAIGRQRLSTLTDQLGNIFQQSMGALNTAIHATASEGTLKNFLTSGDTASRRVAQETLDKIRQDTLSVYVQLLNAGKVMVLSSAKNNLQLHVNIDSVLPSSPPADFTNVGKIFLVGDSMYYPIVAAVSGGNKPIGYIVRWRILQATKPGIQQLAQLIGANGTLYFGNDDGQFWTDMIKPVSKPPVNMDILHEVVEYSRIEGDPLLASARSVPNSRWLILLEFSQKNILEASKLFLRWIIVIGVALTAAGSFVAWLMSRNITNPLNKFTTASARIASGDYTQLVEVNRKDEFGKLAQAFNTMAVQVRNAQWDLEKKVQDRTSDLESANKELEAFSYSVSHDLHAPLRIIDGYAAILAQKSADKLDEEGNKIVTHIRSKARRMGTLIDELLNLSYLGRKELAMEPVDMNAVVRSVIKEQLTLTPGPVNIEIKELLTAVCDSILIRQVWSNLISNALKYSAKKDQPCVEISSFRDGETIIYAIRDNGVGFDMKYSGKLFGVFQRLHGLKEFEGSGVGLALVQRVVVRHGGKVWAEAEEGNGAVFYFSLPA